MPTEFTAAMLRGIDDQVARCSLAGSVLDVYRAAEDIRRENIFDSIALQDIVTRLVSEAGTRCAMEFIHDSTDEIAQFNRKQHPPLSNGKIV